MNFDKINKLSQEAMILKAEIFQCYEMWKLYKNSEVTPTFKVVIEKKKALALIELKLKEEINNPFLV